MRETKSCYMAIFLVPFVLLLGPAPAKESRHDGPQPAVAQDSKPAAAQADGAAQQQLWDSIKDGSDPQGYKTYLAKYPQGRFKREARSRLAALLGEAYASLFTKRVGVNKRWAAVEAQMRRRADLIPYIFEAAKGTGIQEHEVFGDIAEARSRLLNATQAAPEGEGGGKSPEQKQAVIEANKSFGGTIGRLLSLVESYPHFRSSESFQKFQDTLEGTENRINVAREDYNAAVQDYNTARRLPEAEEAAARHGFMGEPFFKAEGGPRVWRHR